MNCRLMDNDLPLETFLVDRDLDSDVRILHTVVTGWIGCNGTVVTRVSANITDWTNDLEQTSNQGSGEEESKGGGERNHEQVQQTHVVVINCNFSNELFMLVLNRVNMAVNIPWQHHPSEQ